MAKRLSEMLSVLKSIHRTRYTDSTMTQIVGQNNGGKMVGYHNIVIPLPMPPNCIYHLIMINGIVNFYMPGYSGDARYPWLIVGSSWFSFPENYFFCVRNISINQSAVEVYIMASWPASYGNAYFDSCDIYVSVAAYG